MLILIAALVALSGCTSQLAASGEYVVIETATADVLQKHPAEAKAVQQLATDLPAILNGTILPTQEATDFQLIVTELQTNQGSKGVIAAAALDGITTQIAANANPNKTAESVASGALNGANAALVQTVSAAIAAGARVVIASQPAT